MLSFKILADIDEVSPQPSHFEAEKAQISQPLLLKAVLQFLYCLCCSLPDTLQELYVSLVLRNTFGLQRNPTNIKALPSFLYFKIALTLEKKEYSGVLQKRYLELLILPISNLRLDTVTYVRSLNLAFQSEVYEDFISPALKPYPYQLTCLCSDKPPL